MPFIRRLNVMALPSRGVFEVDVVDEVVGVGNWRVGGGSWGGGFVCKSPVRMFGPVSLLFIGSLVAVGVCGRTAGSLGGGGLRGRRRGER